MSQLFQVAHFIQSIPGQFLELSLSARTDPKFTEIRVLNRQILTQVTDPAADLTIRISGVGTSVLVSLR